MSSTRQIVSIICDQSVSARRVVTGTSLTEPDSRQGLTLFYGTQALFCATIYSGSPSVPFLPVAGATWLFGIDDIAFSSAQDYVVSLNAQFNIPGDWESLDVANGKISWRANLATSELKTRLAALSGTTATMYGNLWMLTPDGNALIASFPLTIGKTYIDPTTATPAEEITHVTTDALAGIIEQYTENGHKKVRIKNADGIVVAIFNLPGEDA